MKIFYANILRKSLLEINQLTKKYMYMGLHSTILKVEGSH